VALLRPNLFGLFDVCGNVYEWCGVRADAYPAVDSLRPVLDDAADDGECNPDDSCVLRGGDFPTEYGRLRSANRASLKRTSTWPGSGLRIARTVANPVLDVYRADGDGSRARFAVRGAPGRYRLTRRTGGITAEPAEGAIPGTIEVTATAPGVQPFSFAVERTDSSGRVEVSDLLIPAVWSVRWYAWEPDRRAAHLGPPEASWARAVRGRPLHEGTMDRLTLSWNDTHVVPGTPLSHCGAAATTEIDLPEGRYSFEMVSSTGFRLALDDEWLLAQSWPREVNRQCVTRHVASGKHRLRAEYYHTIGAAWVDFQIRKANSLPGK
jgi:hypothetical protein